MSSTYWWSAVKLPEEQGGGFNMLVRAESMEAARGFAQEEHIAAIHDPTPAVTHPACAECFIAGLCFDSAWTGSVGDKPPEDTPVSVVHACPVCLNVCLSLKGTERLVAPDACPRRDPSQDHTTCDGCRHDREQINLVHPRYEAILKAARDIEDFKREKLPLELPDGTVDFARQRRGHTLQQAFDTANQPFSHITSPEMFDRSACIACTWLLLRYWERLPDTFRKILANFPEQVAEAKRGWLEELYLAWVRTDADGRKITHEWLLALTDHNHILRAWVQIPLPDRRILRRAWVTAADDLLQQEGYEDLPPETMEALFNEV